MGTYVPSRFANLPHNINDVIWDKNHPRKINNPPPAKQHKKPPMRFHYIRTINPKYYWKYHIQDDPYIKKGKV